MKLESVVLHRRARPNAIHEVVLGDELAGRLNQNLDDLERATADRDGNPTRSQLAASERIRDLNDTLRRSFVGGQVMTTAGVAAMTDEMRDEVFERVRTFDAFTPDNDPQGEHDFGSFEVDGRKLFWMIDYSTRRWSSARKTRPTRQRRPASSRSCP
jgi:hypothetical protein